MDMIENLRERALSRRAFVTGAASAAALVAAGCSDNGTLPQSAPVGLGFTDADILTFALNLEYLEAEFYLHAATGSGLSTADAGSGAGAVTGGAKISGLTTAQQNILNEIAYDEQEHVRFLRSALTAAGATPVARPAIDISTAFATAATAANGITAAGLPAIPAAFNPYGSFDQFLVAAYTFEDVGVTAYNGAAPLLTTPAYLSAAAGIMAVEAYHAAYVRTSLTGQSITQGTTAYPYALYANRISLLRAALGGGNETAMTGFGAAPTTIATIGTTPLATNSQSYSSIVAADGNALAYYRSTSQVLHIVYGTATAGATTGLFFPSGVNGNIKTAA